MTAEKLSERIRKARIQWVSYPDDEPWNIDKLAIEVEVLEEDMDNTSKAAATLQSALDYCVADKRSLIQERDYWEKEYRKLRENMMKVIYPPQTDLNRLIDNYKEEPET